MFIKKIDIKKIYLFSFLRVYVIDNLNNKTKLTFKKDYFKNNKYINILLQKKIYTKINL